MGNDHLTLHSVGLLSKWGFNDGDVDEYLADWLEAQGFPEDSYDWHDVLIELVQTRLLPQLAACGHQVETTTIGTIHNPIRAVWVDGAEVDWVAAIPRRLSPDSIDIPYWDILKILRGDAP